MSLSPGPARLLRDLEVNAILQVPHVDLLTFRQMAETTSLQGTPPPDVRVETRLIPGAAGLIPARVYWPTAGHGVRPLIVYFHGGGWVAGGITGVDIPMRHLAREVNAVVVSVGYRLAPETQYPGPLDDAYAATLHLSRSATALGSKPSLITVMGDSAGANLAAAVTLMSRDRASMEIAHQVLLYPVLAPARSSTFASYVDNAEGYLLTREAMHYFWDLYAPNEEDQRRPYASPILATSLSGLPSALIISCEFDPLRDEAEEYARRLREGGVPATLIRLDGQIHGYFRLAGHTGDFDRTLKAVRVEVSR